MWWTVSFKGRSNEIFLSALFWSQWTSIEAMTNFVRIFIELFMYENFDKSTSHCHWQRGVKTSRCCLHIMESLNYAYCSKWRIAAYHWQQSIGEQIICWKLLFIIIGCESMLSISLRQKVINPTHCLEQGITLYSGKFILRILKNSHSH